MKFLLVDQNAASEIVSDHVLQTTSFDQGSTLATALTTGTFPAALGTRLHFVRQAGGVYALTGEKSENCLIYDLRQCPVFKPFSPELALLIFQRGLRFALKLWKNLRLSPSEHVFPDKGKAVYFPFPLTSHSSFRVVLERDPALRKAVPAGTGQTLLVFRAGTQDELGANESPDTRIAVDALTALPSARGLVASAPRTVSAVDPHLRVTELGHFDGMGIRSLSYSQWLSRLTTPQRTFVTRVVGGPERIEGPAGTGKTLCLILKSLHTLREAVAKEAEHHSVFVTHSEATRRSIRDVLISLDEHSVVDAERTRTPRSLRVTTLQEWSAHLLGERITEAELLDRDAMSSKELQLLNVLEAYQESARDDLPSHERLLSPEFLAYLRTEEEWRIAEMLRHEIGVTIKGRASENWDRYRRLPPIRYNLPVGNQSDRGFIFSVFKRYKSKLEQSSQFDTDDIVLTAFGQLDTPLWRRRRAREGFDSVFVDETHLFNLNELSLFHHLTRREGFYPIVFAIDRSQAVGDRALTAESISEALADDGGRGATTTKIATVFRSSPAILYAAQAVTASGATLFTTFEDPLSAANSAFTAEEEAKSAPPRYTGVAYDEMEDEAFSRASTLADELQCSRSSIAIVCFGDELYRRLSRYAKERHKPVELLERRGDLEVVNRASRGNLFVLSSAEYIGGLEFDAVVLVGVDERRLPPASGSATVESRQFVEYASHNLLYVALTRARFRAELLGDRTSRPTKLLLSAINAGLVEVVAG